MDLVYESKKVEGQCERPKDAKKLFSGDEELAKRLLARVNALKQAPTLKDIIVQPHYRFHKLLNKGRKNLEGYFAIDIKSHANPWRLILRPLDKDNEPFVPCNIDEIAEIVECVGIKEVSRHYE